MILVLPDLIRSDFASVENNYATWTSRFTSRVILSLDSLKYSQFLYPIIYCHVQLCQLFDKGALSGWKIDYLVVSSTNLQGSLEFSVLFTLVLPINLLFIPNPFHLYSRSSTPKLDYFGVQFRNFVQLQFNFIQTYPSKLIIKEARLSI